MSDSQTSSVTAGTLSLAATCVHPAQAWGQLNGTTWKALLIFLSCSVQARGDIWARHLGQDLGQPQHAGVEHEFGPFKPNSFIHPDSGLGLRLLVWGL